MVFSNCETDSSAEETTTDKAFTNGGTHVGLKLQLSEPQKNEIALMSKMLKLIYELFQKL
jgi:hypothetical protein